MKNSKDAYESERGMKSLMAWKGCSDKWPDTLDNKETCGAKKILLERMMQETKFRENNEYPLAC
jgi:hypothetical protein